MPSPAKVSPQSSRKKLVLCIDDDKKLLHARKLVLEAAGYDVVTASSGRMGLRLLQRHPIHLVISDYRMPKMNGEAVAREIRRTHPHVPILMLSGQIDVPLVSHGLWMHSSPKGSRQRCCWDICPCWRRACWRSALPAE